MIVLKPAALALSTILRIFSVDVSVVRTTHSARTSLVGGKLGVSVSVDFSFAQTGKMRKRAIARNEAAWSLHSSRLGSLKFLAIRFQRKEKKGGFSTLRPRSSVSVAQRNLDASWSVLRARAKNASKI